MTRPLYALYNSVGKEVIIICKDGIICKGKIAEVDEFMNIVLQDSIEYAKNVEKSKILVVRGIGISIIKLDSGLTEGDYYSTKGTDHARYKVHK